MTENMPNQPNALSLALDPDHVTTDAALALADLSDAYHRWEMPGPPPTEPWDYKKNAEALRSLAAQLTDLEAAAGDVTVHFAVFVAQLGLAVKLDGYLENDLLQELIEDLPRSAKAAAEVLRLDTEWADRWEKEMLREGGKDWQEMLLINPDQTDRDNLARFDAVRALHLTKGPTE